MSNPFRYQIGDLVEFRKVLRVAEDYIDEFILTGIIIEQRFVFTADHRFKVQTPRGDHWVNSDHITLLSRAENKT